MSSLFIPSITDLLMLMLVRLYRRVFNHKSPVYPPYEHVTQIGDPVLRRKAINVEAEAVTGPEVKFLVQRMVSVLNEYKCVGLAAPQIGSPLNVMIMEFSQTTLGKFSPEIRKERQMEYLPLTVFINPELTIEESTQEATHLEGCVSVRGYNAEVTRFTDVTVRGLDTEGLPQELKLYGWNARIAQHEVDHLNGVIYVDRMNPKTFECLCWEENNSLAGRAKIDFRN